MPRNEGSSPVSLVSLALTWDAPGHEAVGNYALMPLSLSQIGPEMRRALPMFSISVSAKRLCVLELGVCVRDFTSSQPEWQNSSSCTLAKMDGSV